MKQLCIVVLNHIPGSKAYPEFCELIRENNWHKLSQSTVIFAVESQEQVCEELKSLHDSLAETESISFYLVDPICRQLTQLPNHIQGFIDSHTKNGVTFKLT